GTRCAYVGPNAVLSGFTLTNGHAPPYGAATGGGIFCDTTALVTNCLIVGNFATKGGGASYGTLTSCTVLSNLAVGPDGNGGGAYFCTLTGCFLIGNSAVDFGGGAWGSTLDRCALITNSARLGGGAGFCTLTKCTLVGNVASTD